MRVNIVKSKNAEQVYIIKSFRENGKSTSRIYAKLGNIAELLPFHNNSRQEVLAWAKEQARIYTEADNENSLPISVTFSQDKQIEMNKQVLFNGGYLFLKDIFHSLKLDELCRNISSEHNFEYNFTDILEKLLYARIIEPSSKLSTFEYSRKFIEQPEFDLHQIYRSLDVLYHESDKIQAEVYKSSTSVVKRNTRILYYDCTNYFFEIQDEADSKKYGKSKEHRPNPIIQMGLFMDGDGMPLSFTMFPGNENEQKTLLPLEEKVMQDFKISKFVVCTDAGLASNANRKFNSTAKRSFVVTQSLKKIKAHLKEWALEPSGWQLQGSEAPYDITEIDEVIHKNNIFFKERWIKENGIEQKLIVTYSPKYKLYQRNIRQGQIERASKTVENGANARTKNPDSPSRFIEEVHATKDGEVADKTKLYLKTEKIAEEEKYDGFYAVCTDLDGDISDIIKINKRRWEIEESFKIMKSEFKARPVYLQKDERIKAHFTTCFLSLLILRILEKKLGEQYSVGEIIYTLRNMNFYEAKGLGFVPVYTRTSLTDALHEVFGFRTDSEILSTKTMKKIIKNMKKK